MSNCLPQVRSGNGQVKDLCRVEPELESSQKLHSQVVPTLGVCTSQYWTVSIHLVWLKGRKEGGEGGGREEGREVGRGREGGGREEGREVGRGREGGERKGEGGRGMRFQSLTGEDY